MPTRHNHGPAAQGLARSDQRRLLIVLGVTSAYFITELAGGYLTGSLALLSDAVHLLTDIAALCLALLTLWISTRPASSAKPAPGFRPGRDGGRDRRNRRQQLLRVDDLD